MIAPEPAAGQIWITPSGSMFVVMDVNMATIDEVDGNDEMVCWFWLSDTTKQCHVLRDNFDSLTKSSTYVGELSDLGNILQEKYKHAKDR